MNRATSFLPAAALLGVTCVLAACEAVVPSQSDVPATLTPAPSAAGSDALTVDEMAAIRFRQQFALLASLEHVRAVSRNPAAIRDYGVPLLPAEVAEIEGRSTAAGPAVLLIEAYGAEHLDQFGGVYLDQAAEGQIVALFTGGLERHIPGVWDAVWPELPAVPIQFKQVAHSQRDLVELQERIADDTNEWAAVGIDITAILVDVVGNQVEVGVAGSGAEAEEALVGRYGPGWIRVSAPS
jgi:hypothetical protein